MYNDYVIVTHRETYNQMNVVLSDPSILILFITSNKLYNSKEHVPLFSSQHL